MQTEMIAFLCPLRVLVIGHTNLEKLTGKEIPDIPHYDTIYDFVEKNKGSFYPLNKVPYVKEYIDGCFPYIRDAATDEDGNIRMIPIDISIPIIIYQEEEIHACLPIN